jgi:hypothetical protein
VTELEEPSEEPMGSSTAGALVLTVAGAGVGLAVFTYSRDAFVLLVWAIGAVAVWWAARKPVRDTANPAPPPPPEGAGDANLQFTVIDDPDRPGHAIVIHKETGTS